MPDKNFPVLEPDLQIGFYFRLKSIKDLYFYEALSKTVKGLKIKELDKELAQYVSDDGLQRLASFSLRGEVFFPLPTVLRANPSLIAYYRLLLGFSQKEFYSKGPFGKFRRMEDKGEIKIAINPQIEDLCKSLIQSSEIFIKELDELSVPLVQELQLLTVGPQFRGSMNNKYGQVATQKTFSIIKELVKEYIVASTETSIEIKNDSDRVVMIKFAPDPDIVIIEKMTKSERGLISIEIKGGKDISNIHNRIGEAEKSHQKAKNQGYYEFMTIVSIDFDYEVLRNESPTTNHFYNLEKLGDKDSEEFLHFRDILSSLLSIKQLES